MDIKTKKVYKSSLKDKEFLKDILQADGDTKPNIFSSDLEKHLFAGVYYGYLVAKHGGDWETFIQ